MLIALGAGACCLFGNICFHHPGISYWYEVRNRTETVLVSLNRLAIPRRSRRAR